VRLVDCDDLSFLRVPTPRAPWRVLVSGCLAGLPCGVDGTDYGMGSVRAALLALPTISAVPFCPEAHSLGIPRTMPDIHGGDGRAVLRGEARVLDEHGADLTAAMIAGGQAMLAHAREAGVELALLTDISAACGTQVISEGCRFDSPRRYQRGLGVAAALLVAAGIPVVSQRDDHTLDRLLRIADPRHVPDPDALDHHQRPWYRGYFG
jgi:uncharacterized protein YbbK (DUF523 family)